MREMNRIILVSIFGAFSFLPGGTTAAADAVFAGVAVVVVAAAECSRNRRAITCSTMVGSTPSCAGNCSSVASSRIAARNSGPLPIQA